MVMLYVRALCLWQNGIYIMNLFDWYSAGFSLIIVAIFEIVAFSFMYGK